jgi:hypothetical protein
MDKAQKWCPWHNDGLGQMRPIEEFGLDNSRLDKIQAQCSNCRIKHKRTHYATHGASLNDRYVGIRASARKRGLRFTLTKEQYAALISQPCVYAIQNETGIRTGVDRKDSAKGYTITNCVPCCHRHNTAKSDVFTYEQLLDISKRYGIRCGNVFRTRPQFGQLRGEATCREKE